MERRIPLSVDAVDVRTLPEPESHNEIVGEYSGCESRGGGAREGQGGTTGSHNNQKKVRKRHNVCSMFLDDYFS